MNNVQQEFEKVFPCHHNIEFKRGRYVAIEPYHWGADKCADEQNLKWAGWQAAIKYVTQQQINGE